MAYESSISFAAIKDFRNAEINGIPALFTMCRLDSETLPTGFHSCEVMGGRGSDFQWLVPLALANFTGTFVTRQSLLREGQAFFTGGGRAVMAAPRLVSVPNTKRLLV